MNQLLNERDINFLLYEFLDTEGLLKRERYQEHSKEVFDASIQTGKTIAEKYFANHNAKGDQNEPTFDGEKVTLIEETQAAWDAQVDAGFLSGHYDFEDGGMQLPDVIMRVALGYSTAANPGSAVYGFLTVGSGNLIHSFGSEEQKQRYLQPMKEGRFSGTMALTEPAQGSALADITTKAVPQEDGTYRLFGQKIYISAGDHELSENINHLVLARIEGAPAGTKGISLFICPKFLVNEDGSLGERNDVALAGLLHKMGYRNATSTVLSFGEKDGAEAYLVGEPHKGLGYMFQMMNEARIGVGLGAAVLGYQGYLYSLEYAKGRPQGRHPSQRDPSTKQVNIIEHADVKRMLLAQKVYAEGSLALCLYASSLFEDSQTGETQEIRDEAAQVLDLLTPIVKSYPSKYCLQANEMAIQVLGGAGYIREYPVEQIYRDNRLNPIHEGAEGIHGIDLLGRKVVQAQGAAYRAWAMKVVQEIENANPAVAELAKPLGEALELLNKTTQTLAMKMMSDADLALANATEYMDMFGRIVMGWLWFRKASIAVEACAQQNLHEDETNFYLGKLQAARYFFDWDMRKIPSQAEHLMSLSAVTSEMKAEWF